MALDWDETVYLEAEPAEYLTVARRAKGTDDWFVGSTAGYEGREAVVDFGFLDDGVEYLATVYADAEGTDFKNNPQGYVIEEMVVDNDSELRQWVGAGGGLAISLEPIL